MESFDLKRFGQVCRRLYIVRRKDYLKIFFAALAFFLLLTIFSCAPFHWGEIGEELLAAQFVSMAGLLDNFAKLFLLLCGSFFISDLKNKQERIAELTLPGTNLEKFTARLLGSTLAFVLVLLAAFALGDLLQQAFCMLIHKGAHVSMLKVICNTGSLSFPAPVLFRFLLISWTVNALYVLGGAFFNKAAWLKTSIFLILSFTLFAVAMMLFAYFIYTQTSYEFYLPEGRVSTELLVGINLAIILLSYYFAYRIYTRLQAVNNKWWNI